MEALSVMIQVASFKLTGRRVFRMAPLHHHFELSGLGGTQGHRALLDPVDPVRAPFPLDLEAAMKTSWGSGRLERVLVYGLGLSGRAAARLLLARDTSVVAVDARPEEKLDLSGLSSTGRAQFEVLAGAEPLELPAGGFDAVVVSPGVPMDRPLLAEARSRGIPVIAEVELAAPLLNGPIVAITGSNGKSTTTALTGAMLRAAGFPTVVCGNIGEPLAGLVDGPPGRVFVVELSSFQIEGIVTLKPRVAALLNLCGGPSGPLRQHGGVRRGQEAALPHHGLRGGRGDQRRRPRGRAGRDPRPACAASRAAARSRTAASPPPAGG